MPVCALSLTKNLVLSEDGPQPDIKAPPGKLSSRKVLDTDAGMGTTFC